MEKQLVIQLLPLPRELISIIKEYIYYHEDYIFARQWRQRIIDVIHYTPFKQHEHTVEFYFWSNHRRDPQFQSNFCTACGNYTLIHGIIPTVVECSC